MLILVEETFLAACSREVRAFSEAQATARAFHQTAAAWRLPPVVPPEEGTAADVHAAEGGSIGSAWRGKGLRELTLGCHLYRQGDSDSFEAGISSSARVLNRLSPLTGPDQIIYSMLFVQALLPSYAALNRFN